MDETRWSDKSSWTRFEVSGRRDFRKKRKEKLARPGSSRFFFVFTCGGKFRNRRKTKKIAGSWREGKKNDNRPVYRRPSSYKLCIRGGGGPPGLWRNIRARRAADNYFHSTRLRRRKKKKMLLKKYKTFYPLPNCGRRTRGQHNGVRMHATVGRPVTPHKSWNYIRVQEHVVPVFRPVLKTTVETERQFARIRKKNIENNIFIIDSSDCAQKNVGRLSYICIRYV